MSLGAKAAHTIRCDRIILHFDYDCFYAAVFEAERPELKSLPLAVQQKQIIVTCNYEARRRGLFKLQLISEARRICPEVIIVLGEDLTRFRNASKELHKFLTTFVWNRRCERLGFDEAWLDCTEMIDYNMSIINPYDLKHFFFQLDKNDPSVGFPFDGLTTAGERFPTGYTSDQGRRSPYALDIDGIDALELRLRLGSHLAEHIRRRLQLEKGYTATTGISVNKLLSKLVGNLHKPDSQTTLLPPYNTDQSGGEPSSVNLFLDSHDVGKVPGIGFKMSQKIRAYVLGRPAAFDDGLVYGPSKESVSVGDVRKHPKMSFQVLNDVLGGPGWPKDIGRKILDLIYGKDDSEVDIAKQVPTQISIEDSYLRLDTMEGVERELLKLSNSLLKRMRLDLVELEQENRDLVDTVNSSSEQGHYGFATTHEGRNGTPWVAIPRILRLSTRPRPPRNPDGSRSRAFNRISRSCPFPSFVLADEATERTTLRLVKETLIPLFKKLHPEKNGWDLSLVNLAVTNMQAMASNGRTAEGRDISSMLRSQPVKSNSGMLHPTTRSSTVPQEIGQEDMPAYRAPDNGDMEASNRSSTEQDHGSEDHSVSTQDSAHVEYSYESEDDLFQSRETCSVCGASMPRFALEAHSRFHLNPD